MTKRIAIILLAALPVACSAPSDRKTDAEMDRFVSGLMSQMTLEEKAGQINLVTWDRSLIVDKPAREDASPESMKQLGQVEQTGAQQSTGVAAKIEKGAVGGIFNVGSLEERIRIQEFTMDHSRLGIPMMFGLDVIHGHRTTFPIPLALSSSWDMELIERTAMAAADEASSEGLDWVYSPMVDIVRDPRWGRVAESAGEDAWLGSRVAEAMVRGLQQGDIAQPQTVMACVKHFALYGAAEGGRDYDVADMSLMRMYNEYLPPYRAAVDAGAGSMMSSFNDVNGVPATANRWLLTDLLRDEWGFDGFVVSDYTSVGELVGHGIGDMKTVSARALKAGLDMDMVSEGLYSNLDAALKEGFVTEADIDKACRRILEAKYRLGLFKDPFLRMKRGVTERSKYQELALEAARKTMVLLKNDNNLLPLSPDTRIALVGPLANARFDLKGTWAGYGYTDEVVTIKEGMEKYVPGIRYALGSRITENPDMSKMIGYNPARYDQKRLVAEAVALARASDVVVAVVGESSKMSGESASLQELDLQKPQRELLEALEKTGKPVVLVLVNGRPLTLEWENEHCDAILEAWDPGTRGGDAVADVLFGEYNPSGRLTMTFPKKVGQIPLYYGMKSSGRPYIPFRKYRLGYIDYTIDPLYPFGYGLSYGTVAYSDIRAEKCSGSDAVARVSVTLVNESDRELVETPQLYIKDPVASVTRPMKQLKGFRRVSLAPKESETVTFDVTRDDLMFYDDKLNYIYEPGEFVFEVGCNAENTVSVSLNL